MISYNPSYLTDNKTLLEEFLKLSKYLKDNPIYKVYFCNTLYVVGTTNYNLSALSSGSDTISNGDVVFFKNSYYGKIESVGETTFTILEAVSFKGEGGQGGSVKPSGINFTTGTTEVSVDNTGVELDMHTYIQYNDGTHDTIDTEAKLPLVARLNGGLVVDESQSGEKVEIAIDSVEKTKIDNSLQKLSSAPTEQKLVGINTSNAQNSLGIGSGLDIVNGDIVQKGDITTDDIMSETLVGGQAVELAMFKTTDNYWHQSNTKFDDETEFSGNIKVGGLIKDGTYSSSVEDIVKGSGYANAMTNKHLYYHPIQISANTNDLIIKLVIINNRSTAITTIDDIHDFLMHKSINPYNGYRKQGGLYYSLINCDVLTDSIGKCLRATFNVAGTNISYKIYDNVEETSTAFIGTVIDSINQLF